MKVINIESLPTKVNFPVIRAIPIEKKKSIFKRIFSFSTYRRKFKIMKDYCLWVPSIAKWIFLPANFVFDGASVPKVLNSVFNPTGILLLGAGPHDFGYRYEGLIHVDHKGRLFFVSYTKKELDECFKQLCTYESGMSKASGAATFTLRLFGSLGWKENRKKCCILKVDFPELFEE